MGGGIERGWPEVIGMNVVRVDTGTPGGGQPSRPLKKSRSLARKCKYRLVLPRPARVETAEKYTESTTSTQVGINLPLICEIRNLHKGVKDRSLTRS